MTSGGWERTIGESQSVPSNVEASESCHVCTSAKCCICQPLRFHFVSGKVSSDVGERGRSAYQRNIAVGCALVKGGGARSSLDYDRFCYSRGQKRGCQFHFCPFFASNDRDCSRRLAWERRSSRTSGSGKICKWFQIPEKFANCYFRRVC